MEDQRIVDLYWERAEAAISETQIKYGRYCHSIAYNILNSNQDAEECVNDTYIHAWNAMPPHKPRRLSTFLGKLTRNIALNRYIHNHAQKRFANTEFILDEVEQFLPEAATGQPVVDEIILRDLLNRFLDALPQETRILFVRRYWYFSTVKEIAREYRLSESNVKVTLLRTRNKLKAYLEKEGIAI